MSRLSLEQTRANAERRQVVAEERAREAEQRIAEEARRQTDTAAKTAKLRELRLAKEEAERSTAPKADAKRKKGGQ